MENSDLRKKINLDRKSSLLTDFYIDFMGSLVPGLFTVILSSIAIYFSAKVLCASLSLCTTAISQEFSETLMPLSHFENINFDSYGTTLLLLVVAYVLGSIFYRQDPKVPDHVSAQLAYKACSPEDRKKAAVQPTTRVSEAQDIYPHDAQFPYFFIHEYLSGRGLVHLANLVPWEGRKPETWKYRTKMFINLIKIRLQFVLPERCKDIIRNEAHVRLATSIWYSTKWLMLICGFSLIAVGAAIVVFILKQFSMTFLPILLIDILLLCLGWYVKRKVEKFIHYLRVREIVYVLETAYFAEKNGYNIDLKELAQIEEQDPN